VALALDAHSIPRAVYINGYALIGAVAFSSGVTQSISVAVLVRAPFFFRPLPLASGSCWPLHLP